MAAAKFRPACGLVGWLPHRRYNYAEDDAKSTSAAEVQRDLDAAFAAHPDRILKVADALVKERFYRSSALLKAQLRDEKVVQATMKLLADRERFDKILGRG